MNVFKKIMSPIASIVLFAVICGVVGIDFPIALAVYRDATSQWIPIQFTYKTWTNA